MSIVIAHRQRVVTIPTLASTDLTVAQKLDWLGQWRLGTVSAGDWKNAGRPERASQALPLDALEPNLARMLAMPAGVAPGTADGVKGGAQ